MGFLGDGFHVCEVQLLGTKAGTLKSSVKPTATYTWVVPNITGNETCSNVCPASC